MTQNETLHLRLLMLAALAALALAAIAAIASVGVAGPVAAYAEDGVSAPSAASGEEAQNDEAEQSQAGGGDADAAGGGNDTGGDADAAGGDVGAGDADAAGGGAETGDSGTSGDSPSEKQISAGKTQQPETADAKTIGTVSGLATLWSDKSRFIVKWTGDAAGDVFEVQARSLFARGSTWTTVGKTSDHRMSISRVGSRKVGLGSLFEVRVRVVDGARAGAWSSSQFVYIGWQAPRAHVYSHRGSFTKSYEMHSFKAYSRAIVQGSNHIELDVVSSKSGTLYVSHDADTKAVTGKKRYFRKMTDKQVNRLRTKAGERIHTIASVYRRYGNSVTYLVELKGGAKQVEAFARFIDRYHPKNVIAESKSIGVLKKLDKLYPDMPKLFIASNKAKLKTACASDVVDIVSMKRNLVTAKNVNKVRKSGKVACAHTVNSAKLIKRMIKRNVDVYFTNRTDRAMALERKLRP